MKCRFVSEQLSAYLDDELDPNLAGEVKEHLDACPACTAELQRLRELTGLLHALPRRPAPDGLDQEVACRIERSLLLATPAPRPRRYVVLRRVLSGAALAAAAILLALGAYVMFFPVQSPPPVPDLDTLAFRRDADAKRLRLVGKETVDKPVGDVMAERARAGNQGGKLAFEAGKTPPSAGATDIGLDAIRPSQPDVLNLVVSAADFDAAKKHILAVADSLHIRTLRDLPPQPADTFKAKLSAGVAVRALAPAASPEAGEKPGPPPAETPSDAAMDKDEYRQAALTVDRGLPAFVLALDEQKLPSLVARLAARRVEAYANGAGYPGYVASLDMPAAATSAPAGPAPKDAAGPVDHRAAKGEPAQVSRLVYIRVFLTRPLPAADAKPAAVPPAK